MDQFPKVFVVILNYNGREFIRQCLAGVFGLNYPNFEVVVVDNNSEDGSLEEAKKFFSRAHFIKNEENIGFSAGNNAGIRFALEHMADWVMLLNQDTVVEKNMLEKLIETGQNDPHLGAISPLVLRGDTSKVWFSGGKIDWWRMKTIHERESIKSINYRSDFICGCSMMVRKEVFAKIGLLDEDFFLYWEDADFSVRAKKAGYKLAVTPETHIRHFEKSSAPEGSKIYWLVISGLIFFQKNATPFMKLWGSLYYFLRRVKNWMDLGKGKKEASQVRNAYNDFKKLCQEAK
jgi:GT2 family glycosyltransferase